MHDQLGLEERGVPTAFVATVAFVDGAEAQARALGIEPTAHYVEHPIQDRTDNEMVAIADGAFDEVVRRLLGRQD